MYSSISCLLHNITFRIIPVVFFDSQNSNGTLEVEVKEMISPLAGFPYIMNNVSLVDRQQRF
jgi:hypothetical protein